MRDAYSARRDGVDATLAAARTLVLDGGGASVPLPDACQWPPFVTEAMGDETWVERTFAEVFQASPTGPAEGPASA